MFDLIGTVHCPGVHRMQAPCDPDMAKGISYAICTQRPVSSSQNTMFWHPYRYRFVSIVFTQIGLHSNTPGSEDDPGT
jgi:hypothetical protein